MHRRVVEPRCNAAAAARLAGARLLECVLGLGWGLVVWLALGVGAAAQTAVDGAVAGRVLWRSGQPVGAARVVLRPVDETAAEDAGDVDGAQEERAIVPDRAGSFLMLRLAVGDYVLEVLDGERILAREQVSVELGAMSEVELRVESSAAGAGPESGAPGVGGPCPGVAGGSPKDGVATGRVARRGSAPSQGASHLRSPSSPPAIEDWRGEDASLTSSEVHEAESSSVDSTAEDDRSAEADDSGRPNAGALLSFRGIAPTQNTILLDGVSGDQSFRAGARGSATGGPRAQSSFSQGAVRAFRVAPHSYSAQYGGGAGGLLTTASRRGSSALHGGGTYVVRESAWGAANPFSVETHYHDGAITTAIAKPRDSLQNLGARVGGPIARGRVAQRMFGFAAVEQQFRDFPAIASPSLGPLSATSFYALTATQVALLGNRGVTAAARNAALDYLDSLSGEVPRRADHGLQFGRLDVRAGGHDDVSLSYSRSRFSSPAGSGAGASTAVVARGVGSLGDSTIRTDAVLGRWLHAFSPGTSNPRINNELRGQFAHDLEFEQPRAPLAQEPRIGPGGYAPQVSIQGREFVYGTPASLGREAYPDEQRVQFADVLQWAAGRHLVTLGADWSRVHERIDALNNTDGTFTYDSGATGGRAGGLVDWITDFTFSVNAYPNGGCPSINATVHDFCFRSFTQSFGQQQVEFTTHDFAGFAQDLWRMRAGLTLELGVRYEYTLLPLPQRPNLVLDAAFAATGATGVFPEDRNNAGPRVAVAWSPNAGRWGTVRAGYGVYFGRVPGGRVRAALLDTALPAADTHIHITPTTVTACPQVANQGFGYPCAYESAPPAAIAATTSASLFAYNFRLPAVQQGELTLERVFGHGLSARATYSGAVATQLPNTVDVNIAPSAVLGRYVLQGGDGRVGVRDGEPFIVPLYSARRVSQFGPVTALESNANATWHGLTVEARLRRSEGFAAHASYTWSKAIDYGAEQGATPRVNGQFDPFSVGYDKALADTNFPQRFAGDMVLSSRLRRGSETLQKVASGWRLSTLGSAGSGRPYSYEIFGGTRLSGGSYSINGSGGSGWLPTVGRNTLRLPPRWNVDARLGRGFRMTERLRGEGYAEVFNLANHVNASRVNARAFLAGTAVNGVVPLVFQNPATVAAEGLNTPPFGTVTSSTTGLSHERQVQVGVRLEF